MSGSTNKHARCSPSGAERWADCTASVRFVEKLKEDGKIPEREPDNVYAIAGTFAHDIAEQYLLMLLGKSDEEVPEDGLDYEILNSRSFQKKWLEQQDFYEISDKEILDYMQDNDYTALQEYVDYCMSQIKHKKDRVFVEVKAPLFYSKDKSETGTCDFLIEHHDGSITIVDLKWRRSGMVESEENYQLCIYSNSYIQSYVKLGFMKEPKSTTSISLATFNPLVPPFVKPWETSYGYLKNFCQRFVDAIDIIDDGTYTIFVPTEKGCKWCPAAKHKKCPALNAKVKFALPNSLDMDEASDEDLVRFYQFFPEIAAYAKRVDEHLTRLAENGHPVSGTKLVQGRAGNMKFVDEEEAVRYLKTIGLKDDQIFVRKSKTPTQLTKLVPKASVKGFIDRYTERPEGKMKLAPSDDDRPSMKSVKAGLFKGLK